MVIFITGASRGIGRAIAEIFAADTQKHTLILVAKNAERLQQTTLQLQQQFPAQHFLQYACDLGQKTAIDQLAQWTHSQVPAIDILVNNAGYFIPGSVHNEPEDALETMLQVNLLSAYHLTRALLPPMMQKRSGYIFNICSVASIKAYSNGGAYSISKFAMLGFGKNLREEMKPHNISVTNIIAGAVYTDSWAEANVEKERLMEADDIAKIIFTTTKLSPQACIEEVVVRPQLGDL
ncbi:MAG TPA: SDR family oxidoreductase [Phnomibacter sp.]|nr:SDR family oxidoreductase [Phnomibacter sp.]